MAIPVLMPRQGNTVESCLILSWKKEPGSTVTSGEIICEVETDKAVFEVSAPESGTLLARFFEEGDDVPVLTNIAVIGAEGESVDEFRPDGTPGESAPAAAGSLSQPTPPSAARSGDTGLEVGGAAPDTVPAGSSRVGVSPRARRRAGREGIDPLILRGTGPGGRVIERDVVAAVAGRAPLTPAARDLASTGTIPNRGTGIGGRITAADITASTGAMVGADAAMAPRGEVVEIPVRGMRKLIGDRMLTSLQTTAQLTLSGVADAGALLGLRKRLKGSPEEFGLQKVTVNDLLLYVVARVLTQHPAVNAVLENDAIRQLPSVDLGFAVDTPRGLMVPVIRRAETLGLRQLAQETARLAGECQEGHINPDELSGGTFTVSNLGNLGVRTFTPVLNPPQVGILGVGGIALEPRRGDTGDVEFVETISLSLTIDHRAVDGAPGARFLQAVSQAVAHVDLLVLG